jgi:hypothetical protein
MKSFNWTSMFAIALAAATTYGCAMDRRPAYSKTLNQLKVLGDSGSRLIEKGEDIFEYNSLNSFLAAAAKNGYVAESDVRGKYFEQDGWENPLMYEMMKNGDKILRISSLGENGIWENGEGDDLFVEIRLLENGNVRVMYKPAQ